MAASAGIGIATIPVSGSLLAACGGLGGRDTLKIGVLAPFSGTGSFVGSVVNSSLEAAVKQVNDKGGLGGRKVELLLRDTGDDATAGVREYNQLTGRANVTAILWCGAAGFNLALPEIKRDALPVIAVYEDAFSGGFLYPQGQATGRSVFQMQLPDAYAKAVLGNYAKDDRGYTSAALFYDRVLDPGGVTKQQFEKAFG
jgi:branched-chain amino acid transport system substrate-binding protein